MTIYISVGGMEVTLPKNLTYLMENDTGLILTHKSYVGKGNIHTPNKGTPFSFAAPKFCTKGLLISTVRFT